ncbi:MAG: polysaccharide pyruvyl transferase family protein [Hyphomicrobium sp.]|nr:polysaccharide pyruvyl transferase family protein [Hyphomicrobium sp.]
MYSVDLAGYQILRTSANCVDFFAECRPNVREFKYGCMTLNRYTSQDQLSDYDTIVYWGDFTTSYSYGRREYFNMTATTFFPYSKTLIKMGATRSRVQRQVVHRWEQLYLPQFKNKRYYSVGQNFQTMTKPIFDTLCSTKQDKYRQFGYILPRDSVSLNNLNLIFDDRSPRPNLHQICDVAFLMSGLPKTPPKGLQSKTVGVYFRRSKISNVTELLNALSKHANVVLFTDWIGEGIDFEAAFQKNITRIRECHFIVSDTYHFLINALREGRPVIGLGNAQSEQVSTTGDFKKKVLFSDAGLTEYYIELSSHFLSRSEIDETLRLAGALGEDYWKCYRFDRDTVIQQIKEALAV